ncbi:MAG: class F sortase [Propionibacterium sp.]|nr:class F sortase [Propionibacterium sp.]
MGEKRPESRRGSRGRPGRRAEPPRRPGLTVAALLVVTVLLAGFGFGQLARALSPGPAPVATPWQADLSTDPREAGAEDTPPAAPGAIGAAPDGQSGTEPDDPDPATMGEVTPASMTLEIPDLEVSAPIDPAGSAAGELLLPDHLHRIGHWTGGADLDDDRGTVLLAGHVALGGTPGVGHRWHQVQPGAEIITVDAAGHRHRWRAVELNVYDAHALPIDLFTGQGPHRLALVTCAGPVITVDGRSEYRDNLVIIAEPVRPEGSRW